MTKSTAVFVMTALVLFICFDFSKCQATKNNRREVRGDNVMGLFPFPRVGRSGPGAGSPLTSRFSFLDTDELKHESKRQNLVPFPRVGRNIGVVEEIVNMDELVNCMEECTGVAVEPAPKNNLWWGPRLGRLHKRSGNKPAAWAIVPVSDLHYPYTRDTDFTPRLGRESEEDIAGEEVADVTRHSQRRPTATVTQDN